MKTIHDLLNKINFNVFNTKFNYLTKMIQSLPIAPKIYFNSKIIFPNYTITITKYSENPKIHISNTSNRVLKNLNLTEEEKVQLTELQNSFLNMEEKLEVLTSKIKINLLRFNLRNNFYTDIFIHNLDNNFYYTLSTTNQYIIKHNVHLKELNKTLFIMNI
jgi:hypothetical protein